MGNAWSKIGYGRLNNMAGLKQTGYGTPVPFEETIVGQELGETVIDYDKYITPEETKYDQVVLSSQTAVGKRREDLYAIQEAKRAPKIQVDQKIVLWSWMIGIAVAFIASAIVSFNGITAVALFVGLSASWMSGLFFFFVELMYLLFLVAYLVLASRVDEEGNPEKSGGALLGMIGFGAIAVLANAFHTLDFWEWGITNPQMWAGVVLSISAPIAIISASKLASRVVFARAIRV